MNAIRTVRHWTWIVAVVFASTQGSAALAVDCNNNGVEDAEDIAQGTSEDCQPDGVPDECPAIDISCEAYPYYRLVSPNPQANAFFGGAMALEGDIAMASEGLDDAVAVFRFDGASWNLESTIAAPDITADIFGHDISLHGGRALIIASGEDCPAGSDCGAAYVYRREGSNWVQEARLVASDANPENALHVCALGDDVALLGASTRSCASGGSCGAVYVFRREGTVWSEETILVPSDSAENAGFGADVDIQANIAVVGRYPWGPTASFAKAYVFRFNGTSWVEEAWLFPADGPQSYFGWSVAIHGDAIFVGSPTADSNAGAAYMFRDNGASWVQEAKLSAGMPTFLFGETLDIDGDRAIVGGRFDDCPGAVNCGAAYVYRFNGTAWEEERRVASPSGAAESEFGTRVRIDGQNALVNAPLEVCEAGQYCGACYLLELRLTDTDCDCDALADVCELSGNDCNGNLTPDDCEIAGGATDCQPNGIPDVCEPDCDADGFPDDCAISSGSPDCQPNDIPDECETDCNANTIPDDCDLAAGAPDCNDNLVPDSCEPGGLEDCNDNQTPDLCDIFDQTSPDCDQNLIPDECDLAGGAPDANENGIPDVCELPAGVGDDVCYVGNQPGAPCGTNSECPGGSCGLKSRYVTIESLALVPRIIRVTILAMKECSAGPNIRRGCETNNHCPGGTCVNSPRIGEAWWAGAEVSISNLPRPALRGARLECTATPQSRVWTSGYLYLWGTAVVPNALYEVTMCAPDGTDCSGVVVGTSEWADAVSPFGGPSQPNFQDIDASIRKFQSQASAPDLPRVDIWGTVSQGQPSTVNQVINFSDISGAVSAFMGQPFPFTVPTCSP